MVTELPEFKSFLESSGKISPEDIDIFIKLFMRENQNQLHLKN